MKGLIGSVEVRAWRRASAVRGGVVSGSDLPVVKRLATIEGKERRSRSRRGSVRWGRLALVMCVWRGRSMVGLWLASQLVSLSATRVNSLAGQWWGTGGGGGEGAVTPPTGAVGGGGGVASFLP